MINCPPKVVTTKLRGIKAPWSTLRLEGRAEVAVVQGMGFTAGEND